MTELSRQVGLLVVGGGPAAHSAAAAYVENGGTGGVLVLTADDRVPYDRPPLSKDLLRGESDVEDLPMDELGEGVEVFTGTRVTEVDVGSRRARTSDGGVISFSTCVLATGSEPRRPPVPGADEAWVHVLRTAAQAMRLRADAGDARRAVIVGSGFIGCEAAVSLARRGLAVTLVAQEELPQLVRLGRDVGTRLLAWLRDEGVEVRGGVEVAGFVAGGSDRPHRVELSDGDAVETDLALVAVGVRQLGDLAEAAGADVHEGRVVVDEHMASSRPGLLAAGDVAYARNASAGRHLAVEHWGEALAMGEVAGTTAAGGTASWDGVPGFWSEIGDRTLKQAAWGDGWDEVELVNHPGGGWTAWYSAEGVVVGVATHDADDDYERGEELVRTRGPVPR